MDRHIRAILASSELQVTGDAWKELRAQKLEAIAVTEPTDTVGREALYFEVKAIDGLLSTLSGYTMDLTPSSEDEE